MSWSGQSMYLQPQVYPQIFFFLHKNTPHIAKLKLKYSRKLKKENRGKEKEEEKKEEKKQR